MPRVTKQAQAATALGIGLGTAVALAILAAITGTVYWIIAIGAMVTGIGYLAAEKRRHDS